MNSKEKIIVIEDELELRNTIFELLDIFGYEVITASNGKDGCKAILESSPDLVICDVNMPIMNGYEVLSIIKKQMGKIPPFLFLSACVQLDDIKQGLKLGADDYISKPFSTTELLESIKFRLKKEKNY